MSRLGPILGSDSTSRSLHGLLDASRALDPLDDEESAGNEIAVSVIPEIAAEVVGYAKSGRREYKLRFWQHVR